MTARSTMSCPSAKLLAGRLMCPCHGLLTAPRRRVTQASTRGATFAETIAQRRRCEGDEMAQALVLVLQHIQNHHNERNQPKWSTS